MDDMTIYCFVLDGREVLRFDDHELWARWMSEHRAYNPHVGDAYSSDGNVRVSTVLLTGGTVDFGRDKPSFETALFVGGEMLAVLCRCGSYDNAEKAHKLVCSMVETLHVDGYEFNEAAVTLLREALSTFMYQNHNVREI